MKFLRSREVKINMILMLVISVIASAAGFAMKASTGVLIMAVCIIFIAISITFTYKRYKRIENMAVDIDELLHGIKQISISEASEGELSILQDELAKLMVKMREQAEALTNDKIYLADSIADISHQLRTPLTSINLLVEFLSEPGLDEDKRYELINEMKQLLSRIDWLIGSLLKMSKLDAGTADLHMETVDVAGLVKRTAAIFDITLELKNQKLVTDINSGCSFEGDVKWTSEAIANIIKNCIEHTPEGGTINVTASQNPIFTEIIISDTGCGIAPEDLPHLFERFYKGKNSSEQSIGIGLALARSIISGQNGTIKAENGKRGGAVFTVHFYNVNV